MNTVAPATFQNFDNVISNLEILTVRKTEQNEKFESFLPIFDSVWIQGRYLLLSSQTKWKIVISLAALLAALKISIEEFTFFKYFLERIRNEMIFKQNLVRATPFQNKYSISHWISLYSWKYTNKYSQNYFIDLFWIQIRWFSSRNRVSNQQEIENGRLKFGCVRSAYYFLCNVVVIGESTVAFDVASVHRTGVIPLLFLYLPYRDLRHHTSPLEQKKKKNMAVK